MVVVLLGSVFSTPAAEKKAQAPFASAWKYFYEGKYEQVVKFVEPHSKSENEAVKVEALHLAGRALWAMGQQKQSKSLRERADMAWARMEKLSTLNVNKKRLEIVKALRMIAAGDVEKAAKALEKLMVGRYPATSTPEAAILYARIQTKQGDRQKALKALVFTIGVSGYVTRSQGTESLSKAEVQPFIDMARRLKGQFSKKPPAPVDPAKLAFEKAEKLRRAKKWPEAVRAYQDVMKKYPETDYAPRSDYSIGLCWYGKGLYDGAQKHWDKFIDALPTGPWRGQAYVRIIDLLLEKKLDVSKAVETGNRASTAIKTALNDEKAASSWKHAALDIYFKCGLLAYVEGRHADAGSMLQQALKAEGRHSKQMIQGLKRLVTAAAEKKPIIPEDVSSAAGEKINQTLAMATVYKVVGRNNSAESLYNNVINGKVGAAKPVQKSFAHFGIATLMGMSDNAKSKYATSYKTFPRGSWHAETLSRIAMFIIESAEQRYRKSMKAIDDDPVKSSPESRKHHLQLLNQARASTSKFWKAVLKDFPKSDRCIDATYQIGLISLDVGKFEDGISWLSKALQEDGNHPLAGLSHLRLTDVQLEKLFDIRAAQENSKAGYRWATGRSSSQHSEREKSPGHASIPLWMQTRKEFDEPDPVWMKYNLIIRDGVIDYLNQKYESSVDKFRSADKYSPKPDYVVVRGHIPTGIERVIEAARSRKRLTPKDVLTKPDKIKTIMQLADIYFEVGLYEKASELCRFVLDDRSNPVTPLQKSWAYYRIAMSRYYLKNYIEARKDLILSHASSPKSEWAPKALFYAGTITTNHDRNHEEAVKIYSKVVKQYPGTDYGIKAYYFMGISYQWDHQWTKAKQVFDDFLKRYPKSKWAKAVRDHHLARVQENLDKRN